MNSNFDLFGDFAAVGHPGYADGSREGARGGNRFQSTPTLPPDLKSIKSMKSIKSIQSIKSFKSIKSIKSIKSFKSIALSDFRHAGVII